MSKVLNIANKGYVDQIQWHLMTDTFSPMRLSDQVLLFWLSHRR